MLHVFEAILFRPLSARLPSNFREVRSFGKDEKPHRIQRIVKLREMLFKPRLVLLPLSCHEDEVVKLSAPA